MKYGELAERVGVSAQAMGLFISGQKDPSLYRLHTIAEPGSHRAGNQSRGEGCMAAANCRPS